MCGRCYHLYYLVKDKLWLKINNTDGGCLCLECLIDKANSKGITVKPEDIVYIRMLGGTGWGSTYIVGSSGFSPPTKILVGGDDERS